MHRAGALYCAACGASLASPTTAITEVSSVRPPVDATADQFNRACRSGRVVGARKRGRVWIATVENWNARATAPAPHGVAQREKKPANVTPIRPDAAVLEELGLSSRRTA